MKTKLILVIITASIGGFLFGFDMAVVSGILPFVESQFNLSTAAQGWFVSSALLGCIIGVSFTGELSDRFGRKKILVGAAVLFLLSAIFCVIASSFTALVCARIASGIGVGMASIAVPLYLSEIASDKNRGRLVTYYQLAITLGIVCAYLTNAFVLDYSSVRNNGLSGFMDSAFSVEIWRGMFAMGFLPAALFMLGVCFIPESPKWLARETTRQSDKGAYKQLFSAELRKPMLIGIMLPLFSQLCGINALIYYGPKILTDAGISISNSLLGQIVFGLANLLFTFIAIWKVDQLGRRKLYLLGTIGAFVSLLFTGIFFSLGSGMAVGLLITTICFLACFAFSIGPLKFVVISEIFPTALRARAMAISIMVMWVSDAIIGQLTPMMLQHIGTAGTFWVFSFFCLLAFAFTYKYLPETKGRSLEEIESFWRKEK